MVDSVEVQRDTVSRMEGIPLTANDTWYVLSARWFQQWTDFVGSVHDSSVQAVAPSAIDNTDIMTDERLGILRPDVREGQDYQLLPAKAWGYLHSVYGGGPECPRTVTKRGHELSVDCFPLIVKVVALTPQGEPFPGGGTVHRFRRELLAGDAVSQLRECYRAPAGSLRLWSHRRRDFKLEEGQPMRAAQLRECCRLLL